MAIQATNIELPHAGHSKLRTLLSGWGEAILQALENQADRTIFARTVRALEAKTDAELAEMGIERADIPRHALGSIYHI